MTPEERFTKIENLLASLTEHQAAHDARLERMEVAIDIGFDKVQRQLEASAKTQSFLVDSQTFLTERLSEMAEIQRKDREDFQQRHRQMEEDFNARHRALDEEFTAKLNALIAAQTETERKLQRWIDRQNGGQ